LAEYEQTSDRGDDAVPDRWRVAAWHHGGAFAAADGHDRGASWGGMVAVDHALTDALDWFGRISLSRSATSLAPLALETGINLAPPAQLPGTLGFGVAWLKLDRDLAAAADIANADHETALEATWSIPLGTSWHVQPDLQYILQPGGTAAADDALVLGLRVVWQSDW
jgi:carbohydrate-selective porin OprB